MLTQNEYERAVKGSNGFSCVIERERPDTMEPECYDAEGTRTTLKVRMFVEKQRANGMTEEEIQRAVKEGYKSSLVHPGEPDALMIVVPAMSQ